MEIIPFPDSYDPLGFLSLKKGQTAKPKLNLFGFYSVKSVSKSNPRVEKEEKVVEEKEKNGIKSKYFSSCSRVIKENDLMSYRYKG